MTYDPNIPLKVESPLTSASPIQVNFSELGAIFSKVVGGVFYNHMPFNDANQGKHAAMIFQNQTADPVVDQDLATLYPKNATSTTSTEPQLFVKIPKFLPTAIDTTNAENTPMQLTYNSVNTAGPMYYSFLPGGYLIYFGMVTSAAISPHTITLSPVPSEVKACFAFPQSVGTNGRPLKISVFNTQPAPGSFNVYVDKNGLGLFDFSWMAIGKI